MIAALTGLIAGMVHVWTGPDHLAAVAPLAVRRPKRAWVPGIRWGFGHSAGVAVIGLLSLWLRELLPVDFLSSWGERLVGVMLFGIGIWGLRRALGNKVHTHEHEHDGERHVHVHVHAHKATHDHDQAHHHSHAAFGIGILHGFAGSSHFLGVLPALAFETANEAIAYLVAYGIGTVASMAAFSSLIGLVAARCSIQSARAYSGMMGFCSVAAMVIGCFWLVTSFQ